MPILPTEVQFYLSNPNAGGGYQGIGTPGNSRGKFMSTSQVSAANPIDNLFQDVTGPQNAAGQVDYQCVFVMNNTISGDYMHNPYVWMPLQLFTSGGCFMTVGMDPAGPVPYNSPTAQAALINTNTSAPAGVSAWYSPNMVFTAGLLVPDIAPQYCIAIWIQRTAVDSPPVMPQSLTLQITFSTNA